MSQTFTKSMARNIFYGGTVFFFLLFLALTFDTSRALPERDQRGQRDFESSLHGESVTERPPAFQHWT